MFRCKFSLFAVVVAVAVGSGCELEPEPVGRGTQALSTSNDLSYNQLSYNRLVYNRLVYNRLVYNRLADNRLVYNSLDALETSADGRELLRYLARCAFPDSDSLVTTHEGVEYAFPGLLGLAPQWEHAGIDLGHARLVSACLLAHVNAYGVSVPISLRSFGRIWAGWSEVQDYDVYEATFFGDVFGATLDTYACAGGDPDIAMAHASSRALRVCADDTPDCSIVAVGRCRDVCETYIPYFGWTRCWANGVRYDETVSVYLPGDIAADHSDSCGCGGHNCHLHTDGDDAILDCRLADRCKLDCKGGALCTLLASFGDRLQVRVSGGSEAEVQCAGTDRCDTTCQGSDTECAIDCKGADRCDKVRCESGARCLLDCTDADDCEFKSCSGTVLACPGDIRVCNRPCP